MNLFNIIRENCSSTTWSKGVELSRRDSVTGDQDSGEEIILRVAQRESGISRQVYLWPQDEDWSCDCQSPQDPCEHVAAAVIALKRAHEQGEDLPRSKTAGGRIVYQLERVHGALEFQRYVESEGQRQPLMAPLSSVTTGRVSGPPVVATQEDMQIEMVLGHERRGPLTPKIWERLLPLLRMQEEVYIDGAKIKVAVEPVGLLVRVEDRDQHLWVKGEQDPRITETFQNGLALCADTLVPLQKAEFTDEEKRLLRDGQIFGAKDVSYLVSELLPRLGTRCRLEILSRKLTGKTVEATPLIQLETAEEHGQLTLRARIVYSDPPIAVLENNRLRSFGDEIPQRLLEEERQWRERLMKRFGFDIDQKITVAPTEAVHYVEKLKSFPALIKGRGHEAFMIQGALQPRIRWDSHRLEMSFALSLGGQAKHASADAVLKTWERKEPLVQLLEGGFAHLPRVWLEKHGALVRDLLASLKETDGDVRPVAHLAQKLLKEMGEPIPDELQRLQPDWSAFDKKAGQLPADFKGTLRPYQEVGVNWLSQLRNLRLGGLLADDMGLGKTVQTIATLPSPSLVVCPASVLFNWRDELTKFRPELKINVFHGPKREWVDAADVVLTTYALLRLETDKLRRKTWRMVVLDEAQNIKNPESQMAQAAFTLAADCRVALTGTPVENSLEDLWSQFRFVLPGLLGSRAYFQQTFVKPILAGDQLVQERLQENIRPFVLRRLKKEVAKDLPARTEKTLRVELADDERAIYESLLAATQKEVLAQLELSGNMMAALEALLRLRQAACDAALLPGQTRQTPSSKTTLLVEQLQTAVEEGHKCLVFSQWTSYLDRVGAGLTDAKLPYLRLDGATPNREAIVRGFQANDEAPILIMSLKAGGVGLNLTAADHVYLLDPWWNPAAEDQAADRAHRLGQINPVFIYRMVTADTVEDRIMELQEAKRELAAAALGGPGAGGKLDREELLRLLAP